MPFQPKKTKQKVASTYKTLYISEALVETINQIAIEHETSFNNMVISLLEYSLEKIKEEQ